jgi:hypothetical protein
MTQAPSHNHCYDLEKPLYSYRESSTLGNQNYDWMVKYRSAHKGNRGVINAKVYVVCGR